MKDLYDRIVWTLIAVALGVIALNPWISPTPLGAAPGTIDVNLVKYGGRNISTINPIPVEIMK